MLAEWSAECSAEDPVLVVPWSASPGSPASPASSSSADTTVHFIDLRENPYDLDQIPEAEQHPPLMQALRALNAPRSPIFTAKCDAWPLDPEELQSTILNLGLAPEDHTAGFASYIDLLLRDRSLFASFHQHEQLLDRFARRAAPLDHPDAALDCVLRPAMVDLTAPHEGFSISLYVKALGPDAETAYQRWAAALEAVTALLRSKDFAPA